MERVKIDSLQRAATLYPYVKGKRFYGVYPDYFLMDMPFGRDPYYHCLLGRKHMSEAMMTMDESIKPYAVCKECWDLMIRNFEEKCIVCGDYLEELRLDYQVQYPRDYRYRMHDGKCINAFASLVARTLGYDTGFLEGYPIPNAKLPYSWVLDSEANNSRTPIEMMGHLDYYPDVCCVSEPDIVCVCDYAKGTDTRVSQWDYPMDNQPPIIVKECGRSELPEPRPRMLPEPKIRMLPGPKSLKGF